DPSAGAARQSPEPAVEIHPLPSRKAKKCAVLSPRKDTSRKPRAAHGTLAFSGAGSEDGNGMSFETKRSGAAPDVIAPDGSEVRVLCRVARGSMATFSLPAHSVAKAVAHRSVE